MYNIEKKINKACEKREQMKNGVLMRQHDMQRAVDRALNAKEEISEKVHFDTMNKVIMKHHSKNQQINKQMKDSRAQKAYIAHKKREGEMVLKQKLH